MQADGTLNSDFGVDGKRVIGFDPGPVDVAAGIDVDFAASRMALVGYSGARDVDNDRVTDLAVARLIGLPGELVFSDSFEAPTAERE